MTSHRDAADGASPLTTGWAAFMVLQMALWAFSYPVISLVTSPEGLTGFELTVLRALAAAVLLTPLLVLPVFRRRWPAARERLKIAGWGAWYFAAALTCFNFSIDLGRPELSGVLFAGFPIILALLAAVLQVESWDRQATPWVLVALLGAVIVVTLGDLTKLGVLTDDLTATGLMLLAMCLIAAYALGAKRLLVTNDPLVFTGFALWGGTVVLVPLALFLGGEAFTKIDTLSPALLWGLAYLIVMNTIITEWMSMTGLRQLTVLHIGVFNYLQPPLIVLFSLLMPGTTSRIGWPLIIGGTLILCGASAVGTMQPGRPPWPVALWRRLLGGCTSSGEADTT